MVLYADKVHRKQEITHVKVTVGPSESVQLAIEHLNDAVLTKLRQYNDKVQATVEQSNTAVQDKVKESNAAVLDKVEQSNAAVLHKVERSNAAVLHTVKKSNDEVLATVKNLIKREVTAMVSVDATEGVTMEATKGGILCVKFSNAEDMANYRAKCIDKENGKNMTVQADKVIKVEVDVGESQDVTVHAELRR